MPASLLSAKSKCQSSVAFFVFSWHCLLPIPLHDSSSAVFQHFQKLLLKLEPNPENIICLDWIQLPFPTKQRVARTPCEALWGFQTDGSTWEVPGGPGSARPLMHTDTAQGQCKARRGNRQLCVAHFIAHRKKIRMFFCLFLSVFCKMLFNSQICSPGWKADQACLVCIRPEIATN